MKDRFSGERNKPHYGSTRSIGEAKSAKPDLDRVSAANTAKETAVWLDKISAELLLQRDRLTPAQRKSLKIDLMKRLINRGAQFSSNCEECRKSQVKLSEMTAALTYLTPTSKAEISKHLLGIKTLSTHLTKAHKLVKPGQIIISLLLIGLPLSKSAQQLLDSKWAGIMVGLVVVIIIGLIVESILRAKGKML